MKLSKIKYFLVFASLVMFFSSVDAPIAGATNMDYDQRLKETEEILEFIGEHAVLTDEYDNIIGLDFDKIRERYGQDKGLDLLEKEVKEKTENNRSAWLDCMKSALLDYFGVNIFESLIGGGVLTYIKAKAWKEAAKLIIRYVPGVSVISLVATLVYYSGKCAIWGMKEENGIEGKQHVYT